MPAVKKNATTYGEKDFLPAPRTGDLLLVETFGSKTHVLQWGQGERSWTAGEEGGPV